LTPPLLSNSMERFKMFSARLLSSGSSLYRPRSSFVMLRSQRMHSRSAKPQHRPLIHSITKTRKIHGSQGSFVSNELPMPCRNFTKTVLPRRCNFFKGRQEMYTPQPNCASTHQSRR
jgi:hypothetical protein